MTPVNPRLRTLRRRFVALIAASATALGLLAASAMPSRAEVDGKDLTKLLLGVAIAAIIANELSKDKDDDAKPPVVVGPGTPHAGQARIPAACAIQVTGLRNDRTGYSESCLKSYSIRNLPYHCAVTARIYGRPDRLFPASCLKQAGFRLGR
jgi:hypothetical protein